MRKMKKFATGGRAERGQARYDHMMADIKKDYEKARAKNPDVAKAKMEQRMADAKDDLAKARGEDRSSTRAAEKAAERALSEARRTKGRSVAASETRSSLASRMEDTPTRVSVSEKVDVGPTPSLQRKKETPRPAPRPASSGGSRTSGGSSASSGSTARRSALPDYVTRAGLPTYTAGEKRSAAAPEGKKTTSTSPWAKDSKGNWVNNSDAARAERGKDVASLGVRPLLRNVGTAPDKTARGSAEAGVANNISQYFKEKRERAAAQAKAEQKARADRIARGQRAREAAVAGNAPLRAPELLRSQGYAKGGKIDGCAVRGKTKAKRG